MESFLRFNAERGDYGPGAIAALVRKRVAVVSGRKPIVRDQRLADGRTLRISTRPVSPGHRLITFEDVSEARLAAQRYDVASRAVNEGIYDWDIANGKIYFSERVYKLLGFTARDYRTVAGWRNRIHREDLPRFDAAIVAHLKGQTERFECDYRFRARDGTWLWARQHGVAVRDGKGRAVRLVGATGEINELKKTEEALRNSEQRYELATRAATEGIYDWNVASGALYLSDRAQWGFPQGPLTNLMWLEHVHPEDRRGYRQAVIDHFKGRTAIVEHECRVCNARGEYRWVHDRGIAVRDSQGRAIQLVGAVNDITERKLAAEQLRRAHGEVAEALELQTATAEVLKAISHTTFDLDTVLNTLLENASRLCSADRAVLLRPDGEGNYLPALTFNYGTDSPFLQRLRDHPLRPGRDSSTGRAILDRKIVHVPDVLADPEYKRMDLVGEGEYRTVAAVPMLRDGATTGLITFTKSDEGRGFSERQLQLMQTFADQAAIAIENVRLFNETKEALEQQKASGEVLSAISSSIADAQPVFDKIVRSCERLFAGRIVGLNLVGDDGRIHIGAYHGSGRAEFERIFPLPIGPESGSGLAIVEARVVHYPDTTSDEVPPRTRRGCAVVGVKSVIFAPVLWKGRGIGAIFVGREHVSQFSDKEIALLRTFCDQAAIGIQNARMFREIREKSAQLEIANRHKSEFLANMSHELRTPLNAIIGFSEVLNERYFGELTEKQDEYVKDIHASGRHLLSLINDILDLSKVEAGRMELDVTQFELKAAIENALTLVKERAQRNGIRLGVEVGPELGEIRADERKLKQILLNLLSNAVKFTPAEGTVSITAKRNGAAVEIAVRDTGPGIAAKDHAAVFEEFKQVGSDTARKAEGTGLGMPLAKRFAELHGGSIRLESEPGKGSTFTLVLPLAPAA